MRRIIHFICLLVLLWPGIAISKTIYKCKDDNGKTVFSGRPCADDSISFDIAADPLSQDHANSAVEQLEIIRSLSSKKNDSRQKAKPTKLSCKRTKITSYRAITYNTAQAQMGYYGGVTTSGGSNQCVTIKFTLSGFASTINRNNKKFIQKHFSRVSAVLKDTKTVPIMDGSVTKGRLYSGRTYTGELCYGNYPEKIDYLVCK